MIRTLHGYKSNPSTQRLYPSAHTLEPVYCNFLLDEAFTENARYVGPVLDIPYELFLKRSTQCITCQRRFLAKKQNLCPGCSK